MKKSQNFWSRGEMWAPKPGQVMTMRELDDLGWFAAWRLPLPKRPSVELLEKALMELWNCPYPLCEDLFTTEGAEQACQEMDMFAEKVKAIFRAYPAAHKRIKPEPAPEPE